MSDTHDLYEEAIRGGELYTSLEVTKNTKGYNWTVKIAGIDINKVKEALVETEKFISKTYGAAT